MSLPALDSHKYVKKFSASGFTEPQSEILVELAMESQQYNIDKLATKEQLKQVERVLKQDIDRVESTLKQDIDRVEQVLRAEIAQVRTEIKALKWLVPFMFVNTLAVIALCVGVFLK